MSQISTNTNFFFKYNAEKKKMIYSIINYWNLKYWKFSNTNSSIQHPTLSKFYKLLKTLLAILVLYNEMLQSNTSILNTHLN